VHGADLLVAALKKRVTHDWTVAPLALFVRAAFTVTVPAMSPDVQIQPADAGTFWSPKYSFASARKWFWQE
jgi:hypothetical protein